MSGLEVTVFAGLWIVLAVLAGLVLVMYSQVEKAYRQSHDITAAGLRIGIEAPPFELMVLEGTTPFVFPSEDTLHGLVFISNTCGTCQSLMDQLAAEGHPLDDCDLVLLQGEGGRPAVADRLPDGVKWLGLGEGPEIYRKYAVTTFPLAYLLRGQTILAVGAVEGAEDLRALHEEALRNEAELRESMSSSSDEHASAELLTPQ